MYKKVSPLPRELTIVLTYKDKKVNVVFPEPSVYNIYEIDRLFNNKKYIEIIEKLKIPIKNEVFLQNPVGILKAIIKLINKNAKDNIPEDSNNKINEDKENKFFLFSIFDKLGERYSKDPIELMKKFTPSQIGSISEGINFNANISDSKEYKNDIYLDPEYIENKNKEYSEIMARVYKAKEKLGINT